MSTLKKILNLFLLNLLWLICSLPLVTVGASTCAAFYVSLKIANNEEVQIVKMFFKAFKQDLLQGIMMLFVTLPCAAIGVFMWRYVIKGWDGNYLFLAGAILISILLIMINLYPYALIARYKNTLPNIIRNAAVLCVQYFVNTRKLIGDLSIIIAVIILVNFFARTNPIPANIVLLFFIPEITIYTISKKAKVIFQDIENRPEPEAESEEETEE